MVRKGHKCLFKKRPQRDIKKCPQRDTCKICISIIKYRKMSKDCGNNKGSKVEMHVRERYTWVKHIDFILIDLMCLMISFVVAYYLKFENFLMFEEQEWLSLFFIVCSINLILTLYINPYSGIIRRRYYEQFLREIPLLIYQVVIICIIFYDR